MVLCIGAIKWALIQQCKRHSPNIINLEKTGRGLSGMPRMW